MAIALLGQGLPASQISLTLYFAGCPDPSLTGAGTVCIADYPDSLLGPVPTTKNGNITLHKAHFPRAAIARQKLVTRFLALMKTRTTNSYFFNGFWGGKDFLIRGDLLAWACEGKWKTEDQIGCFSDEPIKDDIYHSFQLFNYGTNASVTSVFYIIGLPDA